MKLSPVTWILVLVAALLGGFVYFKEIRTSSQPAENQTQSTSLFGFEEKQVKRFRVQTRLHNLLFERDRAGKWQMLEPDRVPASDASVAYLLNLLATAQHDRTLTVKREDQKDYGLDQPIATLYLTLDNDQSHKLIIGGYDFNRSNLYAQADPPAETGDLQIVTVSPDFDSAVNRSIAEWKQSVSSPTASPSDSESPSPTAPTASPSSSSSASPTLPPTASPAASPAPSPTP